jgi:hypothetical protein
MFLTAADLRSLHLQNLGRANRPGDDQHEARSLPAVSTSREAYGREERPHASSMRRSGHSGELKSSPTKFPVPKPLWHPTE